ncbi:MAG: hypothetical protein HY678_06830 [Chloroflexi bacterium]|nr:hypothetical protein [Chloroflexota bacterium]
MNISFSTFSSWVRPLGLGILLAGMATMAACSGKPPVATPSVSADATAIPTPIAQKAPEATRIPLKLLKTQTEKGFSGQAFTMTGEGLTPSTEVEFVWITVEGSFDAQVKPDIVEFYEPKFQEKRVTLGRVSTDAQGHIQASFVVPEDYGETHDIYAVIDGQQVAKGGFRILREVTIEPTSGPIGTPITLKVRGLGWKPIEAKMAVRYDNQYTGFVTAITTRGSASAVIRAAGPVGQHVIELSGSGANGGGYLNNQQSPYAHIYPEAGSFRLTFRVTNDAGAPPAVFDWPDPSRVVKPAVEDPITTSVGVAKSSGASVSLAAATGSTMTLDRSSGPVSTKVGLRATNLPANSEFELVWKTVLGHLVGSPGWDREPSRNLGEISVGKVSSDKDGNLAGSFAVPDELGSWHEVQLVKDGAPVALNRFFVERSLVSMSPTRVKVGETVRIELKGIGWSDIDNGFAATYDNAYIGYACGFNSRGTIVLNLPASGAPGTHLIDLYPMTYLRTGKTPWHYMMPQLTYAQDHPGLALGYNLPAFRLAIEVVE